MKGTTTGVGMNGMMKGVVLDCIKTANGCVAQPQAHFHKRSEMVTADRDTRPTGNTFPVKFDRQGVGDGSSYYCISGVGACQCQGYDVKCKTRSFLEWKTRGCTSSAMRVSICSNTSNF